MPKYGKSRGYSKTVTLKNDTVAKCGLCKFQTNSPTAFKLHKNFVHKKKENADAEKGFVYRCSHCLENFKTHKEVNKHSMVHKASFGKKINK